MTYQLDENAEMVLSLPLAGKKIWLIRGFTFSVE